ncbi:MAG TPA: beta-ketoacyl-[acyl-carrier-protein] synthase II, partial [Usitatibacter sp.]|nr:beta-ketoacyl-[acyl-carrier-protein] synthase II [Usitatibacter sp.]
MRPVPITAFTVTSALGRGVSATAEAISAARTGLAPCRFETVGLETFAGEVEGVDAVALPAPLARFDCRNNRAAELGLAQDNFAPAVNAAAARHGPERVGVFIGTSTSGILEAELAYRRRDAASGALPPDFDYRHTHNTFSVAAYVRARLGLSG